jgi:cell division protein FtsI/penicillin-binding protein 2
MESTAMSDSSPMMRRVLRDGSTRKLLIPRKGRIRILLLIFFFAALTLLKISGVFSCDSKKHTDGVKRVEIKKAKKEKGKKRPETKTPAVAIGSAPVINKKAEFGYAEIRSLLSKAPGSYLKPCDTIVSDKKKCIIYYSLDSSLQKLGMSLMKQYKPLYGAIVALHPGTGRVLSLISWNNDSVPSLGDDQFCKSIFPAASIFKTVTAAAAIELAGFTSESLIPHAGRNHTLYKYQLQKDLAIYKDVSLEFAYANSMNPVFARIGLYSLPKNAFVDIGNHFGFNTEIPFELPVEASSLPIPDSTFPIAELASGFNQKTTLSPLHGALIAAAVSQHGQAPYPHIVDSISNGELTIYRAGSKIWRTVMQDRTANVLSEMMKCVARYGTARKSFRYLKNSSRFDEIDYGGKTGSVDKDSVGRVDWFIGFAKHPKDNRQQIAVGILTVHGAYWTVHSSYIAAEYFRKYLRAIQLEEEKALKMIASSSDSTGNKSD